MKKTFLGLVFALVFWSFGYGAELKIAPNNSFIADGKPFFMIGAWAVNQDTIKKISGMGVNTFIGENAWSGMTPEEWLSLVEKENKLAIMHIKNYSDKIKNSPALLAWMHSDEPDIYDEKTKKVPRTEPSKLTADYAFIKKKEPNRPVFLNFGDGMASGQLPVKQKVYTEFFSAADIVSLDVYPVNYYGDDQLHLVAKGVDRMKKISEGKKPVNIIIECTKIRPKKGDRDCRSPTPEELRVQIWMAIVHGANGIGYFVHEMDPYKCGEVDASIQLEMKKQNARVISFAEVLCADNSKKEVTCDTEGDARVETMLKELNGKHYLFAVNARKKPGKSKIKIAGLNSAEAVVNQEERKISVKSGVIEDSFKPYDVHIYEIQ